MNEPTLERKFKLFWDYCYNQVVNSIFRLAKQIYHDDGFKYQLSIYGAYSKDEKIKAVRLEVLLDRPVNKTMLKYIKMFLTIPPIGYNLCYYYEKSVFPIATEYEIKRRLLR